MRQSIMQRNTPENSGDMPGMAYYVYGVIENVPVSSICGIDKRHHVFTIPFNGIAAIVSHVSLDEFGEEPLKENLKSLEWVKEKVLGHERVVEEVMRLCTIIPMKFCIIFNNAKRVLGTLEENYNSFTGLLKTYFNKYEWGLKVYCGPMEEAPISAASGREYITLKKRERDMALEHERRVNVSVREIFRKVRGLAEDVRINRVAPREFLPERDKTQVLNASLLVENANTEELSRVVENLGGMYKKDGLLLELAGPMAVYSFVANGRKDEDNK